LFLASCNTLQRARSFVPVKSPPEAVAVQGIGDTFSVAVSARPLLDQLIGLFLDGGRRLVA